MCCVKGLGSQLELKRFITFGLAVVGLGQKLSDLV